MRTSKLAGLPILGRAAVLAAVLAASLGVGLGVLAVPGGLAETPSLATTTKVPKPRTVEGVVHDKTGKPIEGAVVYLKETRSLAVKSFLSDAAGEFHFRELSMNSDYDLWAELHGKRSKTHSISHFANKPDLHFTLKLDTDK